MDVTAPKTGPGFRSPETWFSDVDWRSTATLLAASADVTMVVDRAGILQDIALGNEDFYPLDLESWIGRPFVDLVAIDSRTKSATLIQIRANEKVQRWREINLMIPSGGTIPLAFTAVRTSDDGEVVLFGRDLATVARLQQRVVDIQREMEADYARLRNAESRYRLLFQMAREPLLIVEAGQGRIVEANPAAARFLDTQPARLLDRPLKSLFDGASDAEFQSVVLAARTLGRSQGTVLRLADQSADVELTVSQYRQDSGQFLVVRLSAVGTVRAGDTPGPAIDVLKRFPEAFVVIEPNGTVIDANLSFVDLAELPSIDAVRGGTIEAWLGRPGIDFGLIINNLKAHGTLRDYATVMRGANGASEDVDVTAVLVPDGPAPMIAMVIRPVRRRGAASAVQMSGMLPSMENLSQLIVTMPLKDLVRETTDMIEQMCIEAALKLTDDNRASAAQILGLSRQSLYAKLHRFGLGDLRNDAD